MPQDNFQQELDNLVAGLFNLGRQVEASLENMASAMERRDAGQAGETMDGAVRARGDVPTHSVISRTRIYPRYPRWIEPEPRLPGAPGVKRRGCT